jgi:hypothetical protein
MQNELGKIIATPPVIAQPAPAAVPEAGAAVAVPVKPVDTTLPDPTRYAKWALFGLLVLAGVIALALNGFELTTKEFKPSDNATANFALFAGFYVAAQVIERLMELLSPLLPPWAPPVAAGADETVKAVQTKADRATVTLGIAAVLGVLASCLFGLFFLKAVGIEVSHTIDSFFTGITIAAGTKPLHDFTSLLQKQNTPPTGTGTKV